MSLSDRLIFALTNLLVYVRYPLLCLRYRVRQGRWADIARPGRYSELIQWRKVFDRNPLFPVFADKLAAKEWVAARWPDLRIPEVVWIGERYQDVPDDCLSPDFAIKLNNGSSTNFFPHRQGTSRADFNSVARSWFAAPILQWLRRVSRQEWAYAPVRPKVFVERRIVDEPLVDINIRVSNGKATMASCATGFKTGNDRLGFFWPDGQPAAGAGSSRWVALDSTFRVPSRYREAIEIAELISEGIDYLRVDFLSAGDRLFVGEITVYPASGFVTDGASTEVSYRYWLESIHLAWPLSTARPWWMSLYLNAFRRWIASREQELGSAGAFLSQLRRTESGESAR